MARNVLVDAGFLVALLHGRDCHHDWAAGQALLLAPPWKTCEAVLSETLHLLGSQGLTAVKGLLERRALLIEFDFGDHLRPVLALMRKYSDVPMSLADACLVRMTETLAEPVLLTTDSDFRIYRRLGRQVVPCVMPG